MSLDVSLWAVRPTQVFDANITHNLNKMAMEVVFDDETTLYDYVWRPDEHEISTAEQLIPYLKRGRDDLMAHPEVYRRLNPENGWGSYEGLVKFITAYLHACENNPDAEVSVSR
jgi:hypothetical protein